MARVLIPLTPVHEPNPGSMVSNREFPSWSPSANPLSFSSRLASYLPALDKFAAKYGRKGRVTASSAGAYAFFAQHYLEDLRPENGKNGTFSLHPNDKGCLDLADFWAESIARVVYLSATPRR